MPLSAAEKTYFASLPAEDQTDRKTLPVSDQKAVLSELIDADKALALTPSSDKRKNGGAKTFSPRSSNRLPGSGSIMGGTASVFEAICKRRDELLQPAATLPDTEEERLNLVVSAYSRVSRNVLDSNSFLPRTRPQHAPHLTRAICHFARDPAVFMVPHGPHRTLQEAVDNAFAGGSSVDFSYPGAGVCPSCGIIPSDLIFAFGTFSPGRASTPLTACFFRRVHYTLTAEWGSHQIPRHL